MTGSLIKLVYFSRHEEKLSNDQRKRSLKQRFGITNGNRRSYPILGGRLHFVKFETGKLNECLDFISSKGLHCGGMCGVLPFHLLMTTIQDRMTIIIDKIKNIHMHAKRNTFESSNKGQEYLGTFTPHSALAIFQIWKRQLTSGLCC